MIIYFPWKIVFYLSPLDMLIREIVYLVSWCPGLWCRRWRPELYEALTFVWVYSPYSHWQPRGSLRFTLFILTAEYKHFTMFNCIYTRSRLLHSTLPVLNCLHLQRLWRTGVSLLHYLHTQPQWQTQLFFVTMFFAQTHTLLSQLHTVYSQCKWHSRLSSLHLVYTYNRSV